MRATSPLYVRLRFTTKDVGKGFYRGNRTGSMGAHTPKGGYIIDYRKVRNYNVPDLNDCKLTPYVTKVLPEKVNTKKTYWWEVNNFHMYEYARSPIPGLDRRQRAMSFVNEWRLNNPDEFDRVVRYQEDTLSHDLERFRSGDQVEILKWFKTTERGRLGAEKARNRAEKVRLQREQGMVEKEQRKLEKEQRCIERGRRRIEERKRLETEQR